MKNSTTLLSTLFLLLMLFCGSTIIACKGDATQQSGDAATQTTPAAPEQPAKRSTRELTSMDETTRANESCLCFKKLYDLRQSTADMLAKGDSTAFSKAETEMRQTRRDAKRCADELVLAIRGNEDKKKAFQAALTKACPNYSSSVLLMTKLNFKPE